MEERATPKIGSWKNFFTLLNDTKPRKILIFFGLFFSLITTLIGLVVPLFTKNLIDNFSIESLSWMVIVGIVLAFIFQAITDGVSMYMLSYMGQQMVARLREKVWKKLVHLPVSYFDETKTGEIVSRLINDTTLVKDLITQHFPQFVSGIISIIGAVTILMIMDWKMTLMMLIAIPITALFITPLGSKMAKISKATQNETADFTGIVSQTLAEIRLMKSSNGEETEIKNGEAGINRLFKFGLKEAKLFSIIGPIIFLVMMAIIVAIIVYGGIRVQEGTLTTGTLIAFLLYLFQIIFPVTSFVTFFTQLQKAKGATERIMEILSMESEDLEKGLDFDVAGKMIQMKDVSFEYNSNEPILADINFETNPGEVIAFAGPSGSGKTTLFSLLERYYSVKEGSIEVGSTPLESISLHSWRRQIGYVSQESAMLSGSIRDNLTYGLEQEFSEDELWKVAKLAYAETFIRELPKGLDTEVGERGMKLSGGQRQRISIARAFLRDPKILMLDEATASLDSQSEGVVQQALSNLMEGRTTFVIAHRLSTIVHADKIIFIEHGRITGMGTHSELVANHELYRSFVEHQLT
ncbi:ABC transporter ATP-binding protein [Carnobacterium maltaromaticum]|uniref:ABC transporter ATP-binding protein n=1 Tax=Carnobacterium maltaromaticum TaxID=2751 RepID=A0AAW9JUJ3_CARML|nr:ABC transporter ATP-binding protein [Carnobacterium maltaromaticum]MDZ5757320.1 ABC transporter ATP-binding protein [Carnobacterium maltaromaticum]